MKYSKNAHLCTPASDKAAREIERMIDEGVQAGALPEGWYDLQATIDGMKVDVFLNNEYLFSVSRTT